MRGSHPECTQVVETFQLPSVDFDPTLERWIRYDVSSQALSQVLAQNLAHDHTVWSL